jgi:AAA domain
MTIELKPPFALPGVNVLLMGPSGTGKTHSIGTLADLGVEVFYLALESGMESLLGYWTDRGKPIPPNLHWHKVAAPTASFTDMIQNAKNINLLNLDALAKMTDPNKSKHNQFVSLLEALNNFPDDRTGEKFGPVNLWDQSRVLVIDGMTGLAEAAMALVIGGKAVRNQSDWGIAQDQVTKITRMLCDNCPCHFVFIAHVERETDAVLGGVKLMVSTLGKAIAPKFPSMFSDVILAERSGEKWTWNTASPMADVKTRNLPIKSDNEPNFKLIFDKWVSRNAAS